MAYFVPGVDDIGVHLPTYEDRLQFLSVEYKSIFGEEAELSASVPDYQLLSVFSRALDDVSALALQAYNARNPFYATGDDLDLMLPLYGMTREEGETDAALRARIKAHLYGETVDPISRLRAGIRTVRANVNGLNQVYVNDTDITDDKGIPPHSMAVVVRTNATSQSWFNRLAQAVYNYKPPGVKSWADIAGGTDYSDAKKLTGNITDAFGNSRTFDFIYSGQKTVMFAIQLSWQPDVDVDQLIDSIKDGVADYINNNFVIGKSLVIPTIYGVVYAAAGSMADKFRVMDIQCIVTFPSGGTWHRDVIECGWDWALETTRTIVTIYDENNNPVR